MVHAAFLAATQLPTSAISVITAQASESETGSCILTPIHRRGVSQDEVPDALHGPAEDFLVLPGRKEIHVVAKKLDHNPVRQFLADP